MLPPMEKTEADALFAQAVELQQAGQWEQARPLYEQLLQHRPDYPHAPHLLGVIVSQQGDWFYARRLIESSLIVTPGDADALANLAWVLFHLGQYDTALARCDEAIAIDGGHARAHLTRGLALRLLGRLEEAVAALDRALVLRPGMADAHNYRGQCKHALGRYAEALKDYDQALALAPNYADAYNNRGASLTLLERGEEALASFRQALALQPRFPEAFFNLGLNLQQDKQYEEALAHYDAALALKPEYPEALVYRAFALQRLRRSPQQCLASLDRALALRPHYFDGLNGRANVLGELGQYAEALENYEQALQINPRHPETNLNRGHALRELGRLEDAAAAYRRALECGADASAGLFALAALGQEQAPAVAPSDYIVSLFDGYARRFDEHLVGKLKYQAHERLCDAVLALRPPPGDVLDLGCGTGLCAPLLKPVAGRFVGVDLSPRMLDAARERGLYTELACEDVAAYLRHQPPATFDLVVSTDVFIYIGDLQPVFEGVRRVLRPGGLFGFSIESTAAGDFILQPTRRYAQSPAYIERLAREHGLEVVRLDPCVIRQEKSEDIGGHIAVLRLPPS
jgi:predicted TPR repeat methyltransferase